ncbi:MAG TPA: hypothetical protein VGL56_04435 [Fimbriimonadaceae bacterium]|jgi:hypothetical protein
MGYIKFLVICFIVSLLLLIGAPRASAQSGQTPVFYVAAHPDDIQLFRGEQAAADASSSSVRVVWIVATAGDAGREVNWWQSREWGTIASIESTLGWTPGTVPSGCSLTYDNPTENGHSILRYTFTDSGSNVRAVLYCMHLPDGDNPGTGYSVTGNESLYKLVTGAESTMYAIDGSATYSSASDVMNTLATIMTNERVATNPNIHVWLNANEYSGMRDSNDYLPSTEDHPDHRALGCILASFANYNGFNRAWWISYSNSNGTALSGSALTTKENEYDAYSSDMYNSMMYFDGSTPYPSGQNWAWNGTGQQMTDETEWSSDYSSFIGHSDVVTRTYGTSDTGNNYALSYP